MDFTGQAVVADCEAGIGTLIRMKPGGVDVVLVVVEPTPKSIEVGQRAVALAREKAFRVIVVAGRLHDQGDLDRIHSAFPDEEVVTVPDDPAIVAAERKGVAPLDTAPDAPAVLALVALAERLLPAAS